MCSEENFKKLELINDHLHNIIELCQKNGGIVKALEDARSTQLAILMLFVRIHNDLKKIQENNEIEILSLFTREEIKGLSCIRNISSHDYEEIDLAIVEQIIRNEVPTLINKIENFINKHENNKNKGYTKKLR